MACTKNEDSLSEFLSDCRCLKTYYECRNSCPNTNLGRRDAIRLQSHELSAFYFQMVAKSVWMLRAESKSILHFFEGYLREKKGETS